MARVFCASGVRGGTLPSVGSTMSEVRRPGRLAETASASFGWWRRGASRPRAEDASAGRPVWRPLIARALPVSSAISASVRNSLRHTSRVAATASRTRSSRGPADPARPTRSSARDRLEPRRPALRVASGPERGSSPFPARQSRPGSRRRPSSSDRLVTWENATPPTGARRRHSCFLFLMSRTSRRHDAG